MGNTIPHGDRLHECSPTCPEAEQRVLARSGDDSPLDRVMDHFGVEYDELVATAAPTRTRPGDQVLPSGNEALTDDQELLIADIKDRRELGIERYGQGHRPFNGRDTLKDFYDEQLDGLVYLRSIIRMVETRKQELVPVIAEVLESLDGLDIEAVAEAVVTRIQGYLVVAPEVEA